MDKRTVIAVLLTFIVLLAWQSLYVAPRQREMARKRAAALREEAYQDSLAALVTGTEDTAAAVTVEREPAERRVEVPATQQAEAPDVEISPLEIAVRTADMRVVLSNLGGEIRSVELFGFRKKDGSFVQLIPEGVSGGFAISLLEGETWTTQKGEGYEARINGRLVEESEEVALGEGEGESVISFSREGPGGGLIEKRFTFRNSGHEFLLTVSMQREGLLREANGYALSWECGMAVTEKDRAGDTRQFAALGMVGEEYYQEAARKFGKEVEKSHEGMVAWAASRTKYFLSAAIPERQKSGQLALLGDKPSNFVGYAIRYPFRGDPRMVEDSFVCYLGPLDMNALKSYGVGLERTIDLGRLRILSVLVLRLMLMLKRFIPNYGVIIIIISILTKILFYRLTHKSTRSMKDMQRLQPKIKELQERFKDDKEKLNKEMMRLYKDAGVNPLGGCLPLLLQMPVFIALYNVLRNTIELRGAPFALWINDLSSPDVLFSFGASIPFIGSEFHLLPILMGGAMVLQTKLGGSPTGEGAPAAQTKMMTTMMPIMFTVIFYGMPSGLVLYWLVNNILSIVQQYYVHKEIEREEQEKVAKIEEKPAETAGSVQRVTEKPKKRQKTGSGKGRKKRKHPPYH
jgi:YidC/Oxa1 family membrane protein insertase